MEKPVQSSPSDDLMPSLHSTEPLSRAGSLGVPSLIAAGVVGVLGVGGALVWRAQSRINQVALASAPKPVTAIAARETQFRPTRTYVGTLRPWIEASVGPQFISAYVDTVLVRPGATVKRNDVLATLDCRNASASTLAVAAEARAIDARQKAFAHESARVQTLLDGGFVSPNEAEQKGAQSAAEEAQLASQRAKLAATTLEVSDCVLRAPFDGEIATRTIDPGAFVRPGTAIVSVVDRSTVRMTFDVPESDFDVVPTTTPVSIHVDAIDKTIVGRSRAARPAPTPRRAPCTSRSISPIRTARFRSTRPVRRRSRSVASFRPRRCRSSRRRSPAPRRRSSSSTAASRTRRHFASKASRGATCSSRPRSSRARASSPRGVRLLNDGDRVGCEGDRLRRPALDSTSRRG